MALSLFGNDVSGEEFTKQAYSGLPEQYRDTMLDQTMPQYLESLSNYDSSVDASTKAATDAYNSTTRNALNGGDVQKVINSLSNRGILNSKVGGDAIGEIMSSIINEGATKAHESALTGATLKANKPTLLNNALTLGKTSESVDPLASYRLMSQLYQSLM